MIVAISSASGFHSVIVLVRKNINLFCKSICAGVDGVACFAIEMSRATQNWLKISDGQCEMIVNGFVKLCELFVCAFDI